MKIFNFLTLKSEPEIITERIQIKVRQLGIAKTVIVRTESNKGVIRRKIEVK